MKYAVYLTFPEGESYLDDSRFDTYEDADEYGLQCMSDYDTGAEIMNMSNPGDYPLLGNAEYDVVEVDE